MLSVVAARMIRRALQPQASSYLLRNSRSFSSTVRSRVKNIGSDEAYAQITIEGTERKAVVYFTAKWCPPTKYEDIDFAKLDVDELNETTSKAGVRSMPTFFYFQKGTFQQSLSVINPFCIRWYKTSRLTMLTANKFSGADEELLRKNVQKLSAL
ncbi:hypothetical protein PsorP6_002607 [Peronosclerospora sorghi]|uniref:Uncharacterized protein n=1 Tax=Peronosclerospora sorghi TaxID=230839 RepID=A0ACC0WXC6_9STRA|nr:hypothetical protein PsorP6_002607 [Peronosclerospora sorghi]